MINYKKTYTESTSWRHWRLSCYCLKLIWHQKKVYIQLLSHIGFDFPNVWIMVIYTYCDVSMLF